MEVDQPVVCFLSDPAERLPQDTNVATQVSRRTVQDCTLFSSIFSECIQCWSFCRGLIVRMLGQVNVCGPLPPYVCYILAISNPCLGLEKYIFCFARKSFTRAYRNIFKIAERSDIFPGCQLLFPV
jgi:hypothetical protein